MAFKAHTQTIKQCKHQKQINMTSIILSVQNQPSPIKVDPNQLKRNLNLGIQNALQTTIYLKKGNLHPKKL